MKILKLIVFVFNALGCVKFAVVGGDKTLKVDRAMQCPGYKNLSFIVEKITLNRYGKLYSSSTKFKVLKTTSTQIKMRLKLSRCRTREALDTCESIPDMVFSTVCMVINLNLPPFSSAMKEIHPPFKCPVEKGTYEMINHTIDAATLSIFPLDGWYWRVYNLIYDKIDGIDKIISCLYIECILVNS